MGCVWVVVTAFSSGGGPPLFLRLLAALGALPGPLGLFRHSQPPLAHHVPVDSQAVFRVSRRFGEWAGCEGLPGLVPLSRAVPPATMVGVRWVRGGLPRGSRTVKVQYSCIVWHTSLRLNCLTLFSEVLRFLGVPSWFEGRLLRGISMPLLQSTNSISPHICST